MTINIRNNADLEVSTPYFFRRVPAVTASAAGGWTYIGTSEQHLFKTYNTTLNDPYADKVGASVGDVRFNINEGDRNIVSHTQSTIRYRNDISQTSVNEFAVVTLNYQINIQGKRREKLKKDNVSITSGSAVVTNISTGNLEVNMIVTGTGIRPDTTILSKTSNSITLSRTATTTISSTTLNFPVGTVELSGNHRFLNGDIIVIEGLGSEWIGNFIVVDQAPAGANNRVRYAYDFGSLPSEPAEDGLFTPDSGLASTNIINGIVGKSMTDNIAELTLSSTNRFLQGDNVSISISDTWFSSNSKILTSSNISGKKIYYSTDISSFALPANSFIYGWTRPRWIDVMANGISNYVYPENPLLLTSPLISSPDNPVVGSQLTVNNSFSNWSTQYRYRSESFSYQWVRSTNNSSWVNIPNANSTTYTLTNDDKNNYINCKVTSTNANPNSNTTVLCNSIFFEPPPPAPTGFTDTPDFTSIAISWDAVTEATGGYEVAINTIIFPPATWISVTSETSYTFSSLTPNQSYFVFVRSKTTSGKTSAVVSRFTATLNPFPTAPSISSITNDRIDAIVLSWNAPSSVGGSAITSYEIQRRTDPSNFDDNAAWTNVGNVTSFEAKSLIADQSYYFKVRARNSYGPGASSSISSAGVKIFIDSITVPVNSTTLNTFSSTGTSARLRNGSVTVAANNAPVSFSIIGPGSFSDTSIVTSASGTAMNGATSQITFYSSKTITTAQTTTINAQATKTNDNGENVIVSGSSLTITTIPLGGLSPNLSGTANANGYTLSHTVNNSYTYTGTVSSPGSYSGAWNTSPISVTIPVVYNVQPTTTKNLTARTVIVDRNASNEPVSNAGITTRVWTVAPSVTTTVNTSRPGYYNGSSTFTGSPNRTATYSYQWEQIAPGTSTWTTSFGGNFSGNNTATLSWTTAITTSRDVRCIVTITASNGFTEVRRTAARQIPGT